MAIKHSLPRWWIIISTLALILGITACIPFGSGQKTEPTPTQMPPPTETSMPAQPTFTPTPTLVVEEPTATPVAEGNEEKPTLTPTPPPPEQPTSPPVGGKEPVVVPVTYKVTAVPKKGNVLQNSSFEDGFDENGVGTGWSTFDNAGAVYAWERDIQHIHVVDGQFAQVMRVMGPGEPDRFVGIYQTVNVIAGETYTLTMHGVIHASTAGRQQTPYGHRVQWAVDHEGRGYWPALDEWTDWTETGWNDVELEEENPTMNSFFEYIVPETDTITLFIRGWSKWPIIHSEAKYFLDGISLMGPVPGEEEVVTVMKDAGDGTIDEEMPTTGGVGTWIPIAGVILVLGFAFWEIRKTWAH